MIPVQEGGFGVVPAILEDNGGGAEVTQEFRVNVSGALEAAELLLAQDREDGRP